MSWSASTKPTAHLPGLLLQRRDDSWGKLTQKTFAWGTLELHEGIFFPHRHSDSRIRN